MAENKFELTNYAIAESAVIGKEVDGHLACETCEGCGMVPSTQALTSKDKRQTHGEGWHWRFVPLKIGVDLCKDCGGDGHQRGKPHGKNMGATGTMQHSTTVEAGT